LKGRGEGEAVRDVGRLGGDGKRDRLVTSTGSVSSEWVSLRFSRVLRGTCRRCVGVDVSREVNRKRRRSEDGGGGGGRVEVVVGKGKGRR
jgi:hypothetical protein